MAMQDGTRPGSGGEAYGAPRAVDLAPSAAPPLESLSLSQVTQASELHSRLVSPRPRSDAGNSSVASRLRLDGRPGSQPYRTGQPGAGALAVAKAAQDMLAVNSVKRQLEGEMEKVEGQLARFQQHSDRLRERLDSKMGAVEGMNVKFDRKLAELSGNYKGLSEEMQSQVRRIDNLDTKLLEWRHQVDEENRSKFAEVENGVQALTSQVRLSNATMEDSFKRFSGKVRRLEQIIEERLSWGEETNQNMMTLDARLQEIEHARLQELSLAPSPQLDTGPGTIVEAPMHFPSGSTSAVGGEVLAIVEARLAEAFRKLDHVSKESQGMNTRVEAQEERLRSLRTIVDAKEESYRVAKFDRQDWESKAKEFQTRAEELDRHRVAHNERMEVLHNRLEKHAQAHEEMSDEVRKIQERSMLEGSSVIIHDPDDSFLGDSACNVAALNALGEKVDNSSERLDDAEVRVTAITTQLASMQSDAELGPRMAVVLESLKQVAPKVMDQETSMREMHEKVGHLDAKVAMLCDHGTSITNDSNLAMRLGQVESEIKRLNEAIEGDEMPDSGGGKV